MKAFAHPDYRSGVALGMLCALMVCCSAWAANAEHITLQYDAVGNVTSLTNPRWSSNYTYDALDRLKTETGVATQTFTYDANGNRTSDGGGSYGYATQSNRLLTRYGTSFTYDNAGRVTGDGTYTYIYNARGQVKQVKQGATVIATYYYDYRNRRTRKVTASATTVYHYDQSDHLIGESSGAGVAQKTYVYRDDIPAAQLDHGSSLTVTYLHADPLGTPRSGRDATGNVVWRWDSDAFGTTAANEDPDGNLQARVINLRFPGQYRDAETGLHYNHRRYQVPGSGRYLESDPIGLDGGTNPYVYVNGNPLRFADPSGLFYPGGTSPYGSMPASYSSQYWLPPKGCSSEKPGCYVYFSWCWGAGGYCPQIAADGEYYYTERFTICFASTSCRTFPHLRKIDRCPVSWSWGMSRG